MQQLPERLHSLPFLSRSSSLPSRSLFICQAQIHPLFPPVLHKDPLIPHLPYTPALISACSDLPPANSLCLTQPGQIVFLPPASRGQSLTLKLKLLMRRCITLHSAPSPLCAQPRTEKEICTSQESPSPACQTPTCHSIGRSVAYLCACTCVRQALSVCRLNLAVDHR